MESRVFEGHGWRKAATVIAVAALVAAGCVRANAREIDAGWSGGSPTADTSPSGLLAASLDASPTAEVDPLASVPAAPAGTWKSIQWTALPATAVFGENSPADVASFQVFGWSRGYVGFEIVYRQPMIDEDAYVPPTVIPGYSADGVHWHVGQKMDVAAAGSQDLLMFRSVIEGPAGLLALGWTAVCGSEYLDSLWTSPDGIAWTPVDPREAFGVEPWSIAHISGGEAGYVAVAFGGAGAWTSKDGRAWQRVDLGAAPFKNSLVDDGTAVSGSFVLAGTTGTSDCGATIVEGSPPPPVYRTASIWWSADSSTWTHVSLPGAEPLPGYQEMQAIHLSDHSVMVVDFTESGSRAWGSRDGRSWIAVSFPEDVYPSQVVSGGSHNLVVEQPEDMSTPGDLRLRTFDDDFALVPIDQSGDAPRLEYWAGYGVVGVGPTGLVATNGDGTQLWFGRPSAE